MRRPSNPDRYPILRKLAGSDYALSRPVEMPDSAIDRGAMAVLAVITTDQEDRSRDIVRTSGIITTQHRLNPVVLLEHGEKHLTSIAQSESPEGEYGVKLYEDYGTGRGYFSQTCPVAEQVFALLDEGVMRGASIGFRPLKAKKRHLYDEDGYTDEKARGLEIESCELLEWSIVSLPDNARCLVAATEILHKNRLNGRPLLDTIRKSLLPYATPVKRNQVVGGYSAPLTKSAPRKDDSHDYASGSLLALVALAGRLGGPDDDAVRRAMQLTVDGLEDGPDPDTLKGPTDPVFKSYAIWKAWANVGSAGQTPAGTAKYKWRDDQTGEVRRQVNEPKTASTKPKLKGKGDGGSEAKEEEKSDEKPASKPTPRGGSVTPEKASEDALAAIKAHLEKPEGITKVELQDVADSLLALKGDQLKDLARGLKALVSGSKPVLAKRIADAMLAKAKGDPEAGKKPARKAPAKKEKPEVKATEENPATDEITTGHPAIDSAIAASKTPADKVNAIFDASSHFSDLAMVGHMPDPHSVMQHMVSAALEGQPASVVKEAAKAIGISSPKGDVRAQIAKQMHQRIQLAVRSHDSILGEESDQADAVKRLRKHGYDVGKGAAKGVNTPKFEQAKKKPEAGPKSPASVDGRTYKEGDRNADGLVLRDGHWRREGEDAEASEGTPHPMDGMTPTEMIKELNRLGSSSTLTPAYVAAQPKGFDHTDPWGLGRVPVPEDVAREAAPIVVDAATRAVAGNSFGHVKVSDIIKDLGERFGLDKIQAQALLVQMHKRGEIDLRPFTQAKAIIPHDELPYAFPLDVDVKYYVRPGKNAPEPAASKPAAKAPAPEPEPAKAAPEPTPTPKKPAGPPAGAIEYHAEAHKALQELREAKAASYLPWTPGLNKDIARYEKTLADLEKQHPQLRADRPGFTGEDAQGRRWTDGRLDPAKKEPEKPREPARVEQPEPPTAPPPRAPESATSAPHAKAQADAVKHAQGKADRLRQRGMTEDADHYDQVANYLSNAGSDFWAKHGAGRGVEQVAQVAGELMQKQKPASATPATPAHPQSPGGVLSALDKLKEGRFFNSVSLPALYDAVSPDGSMDVSEFHDALRHLAKHGAIELRPFTSPIPDLKRGELGMMADQEIKYYVDPTGKQLPPEASQTPPPRASTAAARKDAVNLLHGSNPPKTLADLHARLSRSHQMTVGQFHAVVRDLNKAGLARLERHRGAPHQMTDSHLSMVTDEGVMSGIEGTGSATPEEVRAPLGAKPADAATLKQRVATGGKAKPAAWPKVKPHPGGAAAALAEFNSLHDRALDPDVTVEDMRAGVAKYAGLSKTELDSVARRFGISRNIPTKEKLLDAIFQRMETRKGSYLRAFV